MNRLKHEHPEQEIHFLSPVVCMCATMYRIDLAHLCWSLENLAAGTPVNVIDVDDETAQLVAGGAGADAGSEVTHKAATGGRAIVGTRLVCKVNSPQTRDQRSRLYEIHG